MMSSKHTVDRVEEILRDSSPIFAEAMRTFAYSWQKGEPDLSCLFVAMMEVAAEAKRIEECYEEARDESHDLRQEMAKLRGDIEHMQRIITIKHRPQPGLASVPPL